MKGPVEVTLTKATPPRRGVGWWNDDDYVNDGDVGVLRIGRNLAVFDTTFSESDGVTKRWLAEARAESRGRRLRAPLVVGLVALRGHDPYSNSKHWWGGNFKPNDTTNPIRAVALCFGGSRVLVYHPDTQCYHVRRPDYDTSSWINLYDNMTQLRAFLNDNNITVACFGARDAAKKLAKEWGLHVAWPTEVTDLFVRAYGDVAGSLDAGNGRLMLPAKYWMGKAALARARAKAERDGYDTDDYDKDGTDPWKRANKMVNGLTLERMAPVAIAPDMRLARCPAKVAHADWGAHRYVNQEEWAYAARDAFLCFEIAIRCLEKLGVPTGPCHGRAGAGRVRHRRLQGRHRPVEAGEQEGERLEAGAHGARRDRPGHGADALPGEGGARGLGRAPRRAPGGVGATRSSASRNSASRQAP
jgi:hypothetical protein